MRPITLHECLTQKVTPLVTHFHLNTHVTTSRIHSPVPGKGQKHFIQKVTQVLTHFHVYIHSSTTRVYFCNHALFQENYRDVFCKKWPQCRHISVILFSWRHPQWKILNQKMLKIVLVFKNSKINLCQKWQKWMNLNQKMLSILFGVGKVKN